MHRFFITGTLLAAAIGGSGCTPAKEGSACSLAEPLCRRAEPDAAVAAGWWPPQRNVWTPIGWKDHLFRFNVLYDGTVIASPLLVDLIRLSVIDDVIVEDELHLLRLVPKTWLRTDQLTRFENMATEFGPVTLRFKLAEQGTALQVSYEARFRHEPRKVVLHVPPMAALTRVVINGRPVEKEKGDILLFQRPANIVGGY